MEGFENLGTVTVVNENAMYKVLVGNFNTRDEAARKKEELVKRAFDCFIVTYQDGVRVK
jgi:cell division protein FtsN